MNERGAYEKIIATDDDIQELCIDALHNQQKTYHGNLNHIDTSRVTNFRSLFAHACLLKFQGDISEWSFTNAASTVKMFQSSDFNQPITLRIEQPVDLSCMFENSSFNQPVSSWRLHPMARCDTMFYASSFRQPDLLRSEIIEYAYKTIELEDFRDFIDAQLQKLFHMEKTRNLYIEDAIASLARTPTITADHFIWSLYRPRKMQHPQWSTEMQQYCKRQVKVMQELGMHIHVGLGDQLYTNWKNQQPLEHLELPFMEDK